MACEIGKISKAIAIDCNHIPKQGVEEAFWGNVADIDKDATVFNTDKTAITTLVMKTGTNIYSLGNKQNISTGEYSLSKSDVGNGFIHKFIYKLLSNEDDAKKVIKDLSNDARIFVIINTIDKGASENNGYSILGYESGMMNETTTNSTNENNGATTIELVTKETELESYPPFNYLVNSSATDTASQIATYVL